MKKSKAEIEMKEAMDFWDKYKDGFCTGYYIVDTGIDDGFGIYMKGHRYYEDIEYRIKHHIPELLFSMGYLQRLYWDNNKVYCDFDFELKLSPKIRDLSGLKRKKRVIDNAKTN